jgi:hypothetical protein
MSRQQGAQGRRQSLAFPNRDHAPTEVIQRLGIPQISVLVGLKFRLPELASAGWNASNATALMRMPKTPVHHHHSPVSPQHDVGTPWKVPDVQAEAAARSVQGLSDKDLWLSILAPEARHEGSALFWIYNRHSVELG